MKRPQRGELWRDYIIYVEKTSEAGLLNFTSSDVLYERRAVVKKCRVEKLREIVLIFAKKVCEKSPIVLNLFHI